VFLNRFPLHHRTLFRSGGGNTSDMDLENMFYDDDLYLCLLSHEVPFLSLSCPARVWFSDLMPQDNYEIRRLQTRASICPSAFVSCRDVWTVLDLVRMSRLADIGDTLSGFSVSVGW